MEHDPLRYTNNAVLSFIKGRQFRPHPVVGVGHFDGCDYLIMDTVGQQGTLQRGMYG